jgi:peptidoglycan/xylan/chitin deacetylase (PgdA/CDA1 family)
LNNIEKTFFPRPSEILPRFLRDKNSMPIQIGFFLFGHQGHPAPQFLGNYGRILHSLAEKRAPYTVFLTGTTVDGILEYHPMIRHTIEQAFARDAGAYDPHALELGTSADRHMNLVPLYLKLECWGTHLDLAGEQVARNMEKIRRGFGKNPRGVFPPECVIAPAAAHMLARQGLAYSIIDGAYFTGWGIGQVFQAKGLKFVPRSTRFGMARYVGRDQSWAWNDPFQLVQRIVDYCHRYGIERIVLGCDLDIYEETKIKWPVEQQMSWMGLFADAVYRHPDAEMRNVASIADNYWHPIDLRWALANAGIADPEHYTTCWIDDGLLGFLRYPPSFEVNQKVNDFVRYYGYLRRRIERAGRECWRRGRGDGLSNWCRNLRGWLGQIKEDWYAISGMECRHPGWVREFCPTFEARHAAIMAQLHALEENLGSLECAVYN